MGKFILKRLVGLIPLLLGISLITFFVMHLAPGDPTTLFSDPTVKPEELLRIRANWGLDKPVIVQYGYWLKNVLHGDLGTAYIVNQPVSQMILERLPATILLMGTSLLLTLLIAIPLGVFSAIRKNSAADHAITLFSFLGMSIPSFWLALVLMLIFSSTLGWLPSSGMANPLLRDAGWARVALDTAQHLVLPVTAMVILSLAGLTRYQRASMLEVIHQDFIRTARAKGLPERVVLFKHALKNALLPIITILGLSLPDIIGGAFIIETIFAWPGMGRLGVTAVFSRNYPLIMGVAVFSSLLVVLGNLLADVGYALVDPRIKYQKK